MCNPVADGLNAALDLKRIDEQRLRLDLARTQRELATARMEIAELKLWFARAKSQGKDVPVALTTSGGTRRTVRTPVRRVRIHEMSRQIVSGERQV